MATNDIQVWAASATNIESQTAYLADAGLTNGVGSGTATSSQINKILRQSTLMAAMLGQFIANQTGQNVLDNGSGYSSILTNFIAAINATGRIVLTGNLNLYVATTGSDSNNGLTSGAPFLTLQKAWNFIMMNYDLAGYKVTVNVANGSYTGGVYALGVPVGAIGGIDNNPAQPTPAVQFLGNTGSPSSVSITVTNTNCFFVGSGAQISIAGFTLSASGASGDYNQSGCALYTFANGGIQFTNIIFGTCTSAHILSTTGSTIESLGSAYTISGGASLHVYATVNGYVTTNDSTITLTGTPAFSTAFAGAQQCGILNASSMTFSGSATGSYYSVTKNGVISTGGGSSYFPGNSAGTASTGGQYT